MTPDTQDLIITNIDTRLLDVEGQLSTLYIEQQRLVQARNLLSDDKITQPTQPVPPPLAAAQLLDHPKHLERRPLVAKSELNNGLEGSHADQAHQICLKDVERHWNISEVMLLLSPGNRIRAANALNKAVVLGLLKRAGTGLYVCKKKTARSNVKRRRTRGHPSMSPGERIATDAATMGGRRSDGSGKNTGARSTIGMPYHDHIHQIMLESRDDDWTVDQIFKEYKGPNRQSLLNGLFKAASLKLIKRIHPGVYHVLARRPRKKTTAGAAQTGASATPAKSSQGRKDVIGPDGDLAAIERRKKGDRERKRAKRRGEMKRKTSPQKKATNVSNLVKAREAMAAKRLAAGGNKTARTGKTARSNKKASQPPKEAVPAMSVEDELESLSASFQVKMDQAQTDQDSARASAKGHYANGDAHVPRRRKKEPRAAAAA